MTIYLVNWTHLGDTCGGTERQYSILAKAFPRVKFVSAHKLSNGCQYLGIKIKMINNYLLSQTKAGDIVIKDAGVGTSKLKAKKILHYGNPYKSLLDFYPKHQAADYWKELIDAQRLDAHTADMGIANSSFSKYDAELSNTKIDHVIHQGVDTAFWKPGGKKENYILWVGSQFKENTLPYALSKIEELVGVPIKKVYKEDGLTPEQLLPLYQGALCYFHPFPIEGNSNAVLEALSCNLPVLSSLSGLFYSDFNNKVGDYIANDDSVKDIAARLKVLIKNTEQYHSREFIIDRKLTSDDYIKRIQGVLSDYL